MLTVNTLLRLVYKDEIGQEGRNSQVHIAYDPQLNADLVVKRIDKSEFTSEEDFFNEAQMLYATQHPNIMNIRYATQDGDHVYFTMDHFKNGSLNSLLNKRFLTVKEIIKYSLEFLSGIHYMHTKNLIHFDIKPTNILISDANKAVVTDFGLAKYLNENGFAQPQKLYPLHVPPETYETKMFSYFTDIYQAGLTIYRMCNGNKHFREQLRELNVTNSQQLAKAIHKNYFPKKDSFLPHIPDKFQQIIKRALHPDPEKRYETVLEMINDISSIEVDLDWTYTEYTNAHSVWSRKNNTHEFVLRLEMEDGNWFTKGNKIRILDNDSKKVSKWCTNGYNSKEEAFKQIKRLLKS